ncbi:MAG: hypothetical protein ACO331_14665 [Prochlorothrix sp.]
MIDPRSHAGAWECYPRRSSVVAFPDAPASLIDVSRPLTLTLTLTLTPNPSP